MLVRSNAMAPPGAMELPGLCQPSRHAQCSVHGLPQRRSRCAQPRGMAQRHRRHLRCRVASPTLPETISQPLYEREVRPISPAPPPLDARGTVINDASISKVPEAFLPLLNSIKGAYQRACGSALLGVYVRGSLPKGTFLPGVSDVDTFALVLVEDEGTSSSSSSSSKQPRHARYAPVKEQQLSRLRGEIQDLLVTTEQHFRRLDYTKLEIRLLPLPMSHPAAQQLLAATAELPASAPIPDDVGLTPSMVRELPAAFTLATQSVVLWGWELPQQLPRAAAVPATLDLLPGLVDDVAMALDAAAAAEAAGDMAKQVSAVRWCLKRLIRAALELTSDKQRAYTRDLYWAVQLASPHLPKLAPSLQRALKLYVDLQPDDPATQRLAASAAASAKKRTGAGDAAAGDAAAAKAPGKHHTPAGAPGGLVNGHTLVNGVSMINIGSLTDSANSQGHAEDVGSSGRASPARHTSPLFAGPTARGAGTASPPAAGGAGSPQQHAGVSEAHSSSRKRNWWNQLLVALDLALPEEEDTPEASSSSSSSGAGSAGAHTASSSSGSGAGIGGNGWAAMLQQLFPGLGLATGLSDNPTPSSNTTPSSSSSSSSSVAKATPSAASQAPSSTSSSASSSSQAAAGGTPSSSALPAPLLPQQQPSSSLGSKFLDLKQVGSSSSSSSTSTSTGSLQQQRQDAPTSSSGSSSGFATLFANGARNSFLGGLTSTWADQQAKEEEAKQAAAALAAAAAASMPSAPPPLQMDDFDELAPWQAKQRAEAAGAAAAASSSTSGPSATGSSSSGPSTPSVFLLPPTPEQVAAALAEVAAATAATSSSRARVKPGGTPLSDDELEVLTEEEQLRVAAAAGAARDLVPRVLLQEAAALASTLTRQIDTQFLQQMLQSDPGWVTHHHADQGRRWPLWMSLVPATPEASPELQQQEAAEEARRQRAEAAALVKRQQEEAAAAAKRRQIRRSVAGYATTGGYTAAAAAASSWLGDAVSPDASYGDADATASPQLVTSSGFVMARNPVSLALEAMLQQKETSEQEEIEAEEAQLAYLLEQAEQLMVAAEERSQQATLLGPDAQLAAQYLVAEAEHLLQEAEAAASAYAAGQALDADLGQQLMARAAAAAEYAASSGYSDGYVLGEDGEYYPAQYYDEETGTWYTAEGWEYDQEAWEQYEQQQYDGQQAEWWTEDLAAWEQYYGVPQAEWTAEQQAAWDEYCQEYQEQQQQQQQQQQNAAAAGGQQDAVDWSQYHGEEWDEQQAAEWAAWEAAQQQQGQEAQQQEEEEFVEGAEWSTDMDDPQQQQWAEEGQEVVAVAPRPRLAVQLSEQQQEVVGRLRNSVAWASKVLARQQALLPWKRREPGWGMQGEMLDLIGGTPPPVQVPVTNQARRYDWYDDTDRTAAATTIWRCLLAAPGGRVTPHPEVTGAARSAANAAAACGPVLLRGVAAGWRAVDAWQLGYLQRTGFSGKVRVAPSLQFPFCEPQLAQILVQLKGAAAAPSAEVVMSIAEFVARLKRGSRLRPVVYSPSEYYYMQADVPSHLRGDLELEQLLEQLTVASQASAFDLQGDSYMTGFDLLEGSSSSNGSSSDWAHAPGLAARLRPADPEVVVTQQPRMWVSPAGAVSPTHYDTSHSFLIQLRGRKRMLFWSPDQLGGLYPYPETHLLRRRARLNVADPQWDKFPLASPEELGALEVILEPGDAVFFPSMWSHYTESLTPSVSVTMRLQAQQ